MLISIVIPVYDVSEQLLLRCLNSVLSQIDNDDEIVVVDDGSDIEKSETYDRISRIDERIHYIRQENGGPSSARNNGVLNAEGEYIFFMDSDDYLVDGCIEQAKGIINTAHPDIVFGYVFKDLADDGNKKEISIVNNPKTTAVSKEDLPILLNHILGYETKMYNSQFGYLSDGPVCRFFKRSLFLDTLFDLIPRWNEDTLWNIELLHKCKDAFVCESPWYIYAVRPGSAMQGFRENCYEEYNYIIRKVSVVAETVWGESIDKGVSCRVWHDIFTLSRSYIFNSKNRDSFTKKYNLFKAAVDNEYYQKAILNIDFSYELRRVRRYIKKVLNILMKKRLYVLAYIIIKLYLGR